MIDKRLLMNSFKLKTLSMMSTEARASMGEIHEHPWNKSILPNDLKNIIDKVYRKIDEIANDYNIATTTVEQLIEGKRVETNLEAQGLYEKKTINQMSAIREEINSIQHKIENEKFELEQEKEIIRDNTNDQQTNINMSESLYKNIVLSAKDIHNRLKTEIFERESNPSEAQRKVQGIAEDIMSCIRSMNLPENIQETLDIDDRLIASKINHELEEINHEMNKTDRERFMEGVKVERTPEIPKDFFKRQEEEKEKEQEQEYLSSNVIE